MGLADWWIISKRPKMAPSFWVASIVCTLLSLVHISLFPIISISTGELKPRGTYFEENSLLPSLATSSYSRPYTSSITNTSTELCQFIENNGLPCYNHDSSLIWTVVRPYFIDEGKEVLVLVALSDRDCDFASHFVSLLKHMKGERWLTKSVVLLVPLGRSTDSCSKRNDSRIVVDEWLSLFEGRNRDGRSHLLPVTGTIRAAIAIDIHKYSSSSTFDINLNVVGNNGQLPNMDLPNLVSHAFKNFVSIERRGPALKYLSSTYEVLLQGMVDMFSSMLKSPPSIHAVFLNRGIDAITVDLLDVRERVGNHRKMVGSGIESIVRSTESVVRSLNMAEQKLTHGFFLYSFMTASYFVSIGEFSITVTLIVASYALLALKSFPHITSLLPSLQLISASYIMVATCSAAGVFDTLPTSLVGFSFMLGVLLCATRVGMIEMPCPHAALFLNSLCMGCMNATEVFQNISIAVVGPPLGLLCCSGIFIKLNVADVVVNTSRVCLWLLTCLLLAYLLSSQAFASGHDLFMLCAACHITSLLTGISASDIETN